MKGFARAPSLGLPRGPSGKLLSRLPFCQAEANSSQGRTRSGSQLGTRGVSSRTLLLRLRYRSHPPMPVPTSEGASAAALRSVRRVLARRSPWLPYHHRQIAACSRVGPQPSDRGDCPKPLSEALDVPLCIESYRSTRPQAANKRRGSPLDDGRRNWTGASPHRCNVSSRTAGCTPRVGWPAREETLQRCGEAPVQLRRDRKSTRLNSS